MAIGQIEQLTRRESSSETNSRNEIFRGTAHIPEIGNGVPVYFKVMRPEVNHLGWMNELLGSRAAKICGLPAPLAYLCWCQRFQMPIPQMVGRENEVVIGVATLDSNPNAPSQRIRNPEFFESEILSWDRAPIAAAFDELVDNIDRNICNFIRRAAGAFELVDHEDLLGGISWLGRPLSARVATPCMNNKLASSISATQDNERMNMLIRAAHLCVEKADFTQLHVDPTDLRACGCSGQDAVRFITYLEKRKLLVPQLMFTHVRMGQLFTGS